jgi:hypothetical protein
MTGPTSVPIMPQGGGMMQQVNEFLDKHVLPYPVRYLTNRITILATLSLLVPLILLANVTVFVLATNSYLNVMSVVVSSTVLLYSSLSESRDRAASDRREEIAKQHQEIIDARAQADHEAIQLIHDHLDGMNRELLQNVSSALDNIQKLLVGKLDDIDAEHKARVADLHSALAASTDTHKQELADLHKMLDTLRSNSAGPTSS